MMLKHLSSKPYKSLCYGIGVSASVFMLSACGGSGSSGGNEPAGPIISVSEASVLEGDLNNTTSVTFTLTLAEPADQATSVDYTTQDGTATSGEDYTAITGTLNFTAGETSATLTVDVVGDNTFEVDEYFALILSNAQGLELNESSIGKGTIETDEDADSKGYFFGTATMGNTEVSDLIGLAYDGRLMLFSKTGNPDVLYDITEMAVTGTSYTGKVDVYEDGEIAFSGISVKGETTEASISGTVTQLDSVKGSFEVAFIEEANQGAANWARIETDNSPTWANEAHRDITSGDGMLFNARLYQAYMGRTYDSSEHCASDGTLGFRDVNIYGLAHDVVSNVIPFPCTIASNGHSGFASVITDENEDDTLVYAFSNGTFSQFVTLTR